MAHDRQGRKGVRYDGAFEMLEANGEPSLAEGVIRGLRLVLFPLGDMDALVLGLDGEFRRDDADGRDQEAEEDPGAVRKQAAS